MQIYSNKDKLVNAKLLEVALEKTGNNVENLAVGVLFVSSFKIKKLNKKSRQINKVTDVLSFPMLEGKKFEFLQDCDEERDPFSEELYLGDIVICKTRAKKQAKLFGHSFKREVGFLMLHGFLHLLGFDHIKSKDEKQMQKLAEEVLNQCGVLRGDNV